MLQKRNGYETETETDMTSDPRQVFVTSRGSKSNLHIDGKGRMMKEGTSPDERTILLSTLRCSYLGNIPSLQPCSRCPGHPYILLLLLIAMIAIHNWRL